MNDFWKTQPVLPVVVVNDKVKAVQLARTLAKAGVTKIEVTLRTPNALECIAAIAAEVPECVVGVGTVLTPAQGAAAVAAGAKFLVSPGVTEDLLDYVAESAIPFIPGCATLSEAMRLVERGLTAAKFFPAVESGGAAWLKAVNSVLPQLQFCPTGGIGQSNYKEFLELPNVMCVGGSWIAPAKLIEDENWSEIEKLAALAAR
jgi:2-dehydro-3-deoxyphosphogluconate aldolase/(4S)-4-hydroxy-2-oxoglutarate aldolase